MHIDSNQVHSLSKIVVHTCYHIPIRLDHILTIIKSNSYRRSNRSQPQSPYRLKGIKSKVVSVEKERKSRERPTTNVAFRQANLFFFQRGREESKSAEKKRAKWHYPAHAH